MILNTVVRTVLALAGVRDMDLYVTQALAGNLFLAVGLACLVYYLTFLLTGRRAVLPFIIALYGAYYAYLTWTAVRVGDRRIELGEWQARLVGETPPTPWESLVFGALLALPILALVVVYAVLAFKVRGAATRYRLRLVVSAFLLLFGSVLLAYLLRWNERPWFPLTYQVPALVAAALVVLAYRPPRRLAAALA